MFQSDEDEALALEEYTNFERNNRAPGLIAKLVTALGPRFVDRKVAFVLKVDEGDQDEDDMYYYKKPIFDFIEFFCTINERSPQFVLSSLVVR